jgi:hypothetical protein
MDDWNKKKHVRPPGHDTVLALGLKTVYYSVTQLLVRRRLFDEVGLFGREWGSFGDLEWQMRAALTTQTVHVPEYLATWRIHPQQSSQMTGYIKAVHEGNFLKMADGVIAFSQARKLPFPGGLPNRLRRFYWAEYISDLLGNEPSAAGKIKVLLQSFRADPALIWPFVRSRCRKYILRQLPDPENHVRRELQRLKLDNVSAVEIKL